MDVSLRRGWERKSRAEDGPEAGQGVGAESTRRGGCVQVKARRAASVAEEGAREEVGSKVSLEQYTPLLARPQPKKDAEATARAQQAKKPRQTGTPTGNGEHAQMSAQGSSIREEAGGRSGRLGLEAEQASWNRPTNRRSSSSPLVADAESRTDLTKVPKSLL